MNLDSSAFVAEPELLEKLWKHAVCLECPNGRTLFNQGDEPTGLFLLLSGEAMMILENEVGAPLLRTSMEPGAILGLPALVSDKPYSMTAIAKKGARVGHVTREDFSLMMLSEPTLALMIVRVLAAEVRSTRTTLSEYPSSLHRGRTTRRKTTTRSERTRTAD